MNFDLLDNDIFLISAFVLSTFFVDVLPLAAYLVICGLPGSRKTTLLRFLHCVTRRALHAGELSRASLYKLTDLISPTLLLDESDMGGGKASRDVMRVLRNGNRPGADTYVNGQRYRTYGAKVICGRRAPEDSALNSRAVHSHTNGGRIFPSLIQMPSGRSRQTCSRSWSASGWSTIAMSAFMNCRVPRPSPPEYATSAAYWPRPYSETQS